MRARNIEKGLEPMPAEDVPAVRMPVAVFEETSAEGEALEEIERKQILRVLQKNGGNRGATAKELGISLPKLYYRLGEYEQKGHLS